METGLYKKKATDWETFTVDFFAPHLFFRSGGCGANALSLITGIPPNKIKNTNVKNKEHWKDSFMIKFLKNRGYSVQPVTKCEVTNEIGMYAPDNINDQHVILLSQLMGKNIASWTVVHNKLWYHNFQTCSFTGLTSLNSPTLTVYVVYHPKWKIDNYKIEPGYGVYS